MRRDTPRENVDPIGAEVETHYHFIGTVVADCLREQAAGKSSAISRTDRIDRIVTNKFSGMLIFVGLMGLMFLEHLLLGAADHGFHQGRTSSAVLAIGSAATWPTVRCKA